MSDFVIGRVLHLFKFKVFPILFSFFLVGCGGGGGSSGDNGHEHALTNAQTPIFGNVHLEDAVYQKNMISHVQYLSVSASVNDGSELTYQWYKNENNSNEDGEPIANETKARYKPPISATGTLYYYVAVTNSAVSGNTTSTAVSRAVEITVNELANARVPTISTQPHSAVYKNGVTGVAELKVTASVSDGGTLSYQWYKNENNSNEDGDLIEGADQPAYTPSTDKSAYYYVVITNHNSGIDGNKYAKITSDAVKIEIYDYDYKVITTWYEPVTSPRNSIFIGTFNYDAQTRTVSNLRGILSESMTGTREYAYPNDSMTWLDLEYQLETWYDDTLGGTFAAVFKNNNTTTFYDRYNNSSGWTPEFGVEVGGQYYDWSTGTNAYNAYALIFIPDNPTTPLTQAQIDKLAYADCAPGGMMGSVCMTGTSAAGYGAIGTMSGYPISQIITEETVPNIISYDITTTWYEPDTQPNDSIFIGTFDYDPNTHTVSNLKGKLSESMTDDGGAGYPNDNMIWLDLEYQLVTWYDDTLGGTFAATFKNNNTSTFWTGLGGDGWSPEAGIAVGGAYDGFPTPAQNPGNAYALIFIPDNPTTPLTQAQIDKLAYADCAPGGMMGSACMTGTSAAGYGYTGTMDGYPVFQNIMLAQ
jgi:hypothetical protein